MAVCPGIKRDGTRCTAVVSGSQTRCYQSTIRPIQPSASKTLQRLGEGVSARDVYRLRYT